MDFSAIAPIKFEELSPMTGRIDEVFDLEEEISIQIPEKREPKICSDINHSVPQSQPLLVFDTESASQFFRFEDNDQTAIKIEEQGQVTGWTNATVMIKQKFLVSSTMSIKFKFSKHGAFGICSDKSAKGIPGYLDSKGWMWNRNGKEFYSSCKKYTKDIGIGDMGFGKEVEMTYDGKAKIIKISCEG